MLSCVWLSVTPWTVAHQAPLSMGILHARILEWVAMPSSRGSPQPRGWTGVSCIAERFFTIWATRKPKNTGVSSLFLLQGIFPSQELKWSLRHCRWILHQLNYQVYTTPILKCLKSRFPTFPKKVGSLFFNLLWPTLRLSTSLCIYEHICYKLLVLDL